MKTRNLLLHLVFLIIVILSLYSAWTGDRTYEYIGKPMILPWIALYFLLNTPDAPHRWLVLLAFLFSWIGDLLLMFSWKNELFFFAGVGGFFLSQIAFILSFGKYNLLSGKGLIQRRPLWLLPFLVCCTGIFLLIKPGLEGPMLYVVLIYAISIIGMSIAAFNRYGLTNISAFWLAFSGSLLFIVSDSLLAYNKFITEINKGGLIVMITYIGAQYLIMLGLARSHRQI